jgi:uncharacterized membrane protein YcaP (DUF421 family)
MTWVAELGETLFGHGRDLDPLQTSCRAFVMFALALALVRIAGMRAFGRKSSHDTIIVIMLGAVLARAVTGESPFWATVAAGTVLVVVHRVIAMGCARSHRLERLIKGSHRVLYQRGEINWSGMRRAGISRGDLDEATRGKANVRSHTEVSAIYIESSGELTVIESDAMGRDHGIAETPLRPGHRAKPEALDERSEGSAETDVRGGRMKYGLPAAGPAIPPVP